MASSHSLSSNGSSWPTIYAPPPTQDPSMQQMPCVFVTPPEEELEYNPPWCYFNAGEVTKNGQNMPLDMDILDVALSFHQQTDNRAPTFHRSLSNESRDTIIMPRRGGGDSRRRRGHVLDEDVVEVMKVRRSEGMSDVGDVGSQTLKKSKTFRARASQALRSIKNVGKPGRRVSATNLASKPETQPAPPLPDADAVSPLQCTEPEPEPIPPRPTTPNLSRRKSLQLSQLFTFSQNSRTTPAPSDEPPRPPSPPAKASYQSIPMFTNPLSSHSKRLRPSPSLEDYGENPSAATSGHTPTLSKRKSFRRRISALELHNLFSRNNVQSQQEQFQPEEFPDACMTEGDSSEVIVDIFPAAASRAFSTDSAETACSSASSTTMTARSSTSGTDRTEPEQDDDDLEMQLDSLHFDSLHFDPEEF